MRLLPLLLLLLLIGCRSPAPDSVELPVAQLSGISEGTRMAQRLVGLGVGIVVDGRVAYLGGFGEADHEQGIRFDPQRTPRLPVACVDWCDATQLVVDKRTRRVVAKPISTFLFKIFSNLY